MRAALSNRDDDRVPSPVWAPSVSELLLDMTGVCRRFGRACSSASLEVQMSSKVAVCMACPLNRLGLIDLVRLVHAAPSILLFWALRC